MLNVLNAMLMYQIFSSRVCINSPFSITAGPFFIKNHYGLRRKVSKRYICLFVCFSTNAMHFELVFNLSSFAFIQALRWFKSRRGEPVRIYSDNCANYVGANNKLKDLHKFLISNLEELEYKASLENIEWKFIPPISSPYFGGL